ncbi:7 transmembrane receptor, partial [Cooperia oncophora]
MQWDSTWALVPAGFSMLGLASTVFVVGVFLKFSNTPVIMASGRELCYCMISGISMCYILTFFLVSQPTIPTCAITRVVDGSLSSVSYLRGYHHEDESTGTGLQARQRSTAAIHHPQSTSQLFVDFSYAVIRLRDQLEVAFKGDRRNKEALAMVGRVAGRVGICACIVSVQLIGSIIWLLVDPPGTKIVFPSRTEAVLTCK